MFIITFFTVLCKTFFRGPTAREIYAMQRTIIAAYYLKHA